MLRKAIASSLLFCPLAAFAAGSFFAQEPPSIAGHPFSAVATSHSTTQFSDGNRIVRTNIVRYFRDGQGRVRTERNQSGQGAATSQNISIVIIDDPVSGERYNLMPQSKAAVVWKLSGSTREHLQAAAGAQEAPFALLGLGMAIGASAATESSEATTSLGQKTIAGVNTTGTRIVRTIPSGVLGNEKPITSTIEEWDSSDLGIPVQVTEKSSLGGVTTLTLGEVVFGEPDPALFTVPGGYSKVDLSSALPQNGATTVSGSAITAVKKP